MNSQTPKLAFLQTTDDVAVGDRIVTSGHGGMFPAGIPVGLVSSVDGNAAVVSPFVGFSRLEYVRVVQFDFPGIDSADDAIMGRGR